jgi:hypothetical protein
MSEPIRGTSKHGDLTIDQLVELQPGLGRLMPEISRRYWILFYAAQGGNWPLAGYQWRQLRHLFNTGSVTRPKRAKELQAFLAGAMKDLETAIEARDWSQFEKAYREGMALANRLHQATGHAEIRWQLPPEPPKDLDLGPGEG